MTRVSQYNKKTDTTYIYESESYYDPDKKQSRSRRKLIGKIDKETGEIVPTGKRGPKKKSGSQAVRNTTDQVNGKSTSARAEDGISDPSFRLEFLEEKIETQEKEILILRSRLATLEGENARLRELSTDAGQMRRENERMSGILQKIRLLMNDQEP